MVDKVPTGVFQDGTISNAHVSDAIIDSDCEFVPAPASGISIKIQGGRFSNVKFIGGVFKNCHIGSTQKSNESRGGVSHAEIVRYLRDNHISASILHEVHYRDVERGWDVPNLSEGYFQRCRASGELIPVESFRYVRNSLPKMQAMADLPRLLWTAESDRLLVDFMMKAHNDVWKVASMMAKATGSFVTAGMVRGRFHNALKKSARAILKRRLRPDQTEYVLAA